MSFGRALTQALGTHLQQFKSALPAAQKAASIHTTAASHSAPPQSLMDRFSQAYTKRRITEFFVPGGVGRAAAALNKSERIMILTGFNVDTKTDGRPLPESDGPPGAAMLAITAARLGKIVSIVTDKANNPIVRAALQSIDKETAKEITLKTFEGIKEETPEGKAEKILKNFNPDTVVAIELPGRTTEGVPRTMRGADNSSFNPPIERILEAANANNEITTIGMGDGRNEAGLGNAPGEHLQALDGSHFASVVPSDIPVTSFTSNNAAAAVAATMLVHVGAEHQLIPGKDYAAAILAVLKAGAVDGVTRLRKPDSESSDGQSRTGVDGFSVEANARFVDAINTIAMKEGPVRGIAYADEVKDGPFLALLFDSSIGGAIAAKNMRIMIEQMKESFPDVRMALALDFGNAPYGEKRRPALIKLVVDGISIAEKAKFDAVVMACNTACSAFKRDSKDEEGIDIEKFPVPVVDLIQNTSTEIARNGGARPVILSTQATAEDPMYIERVSTARQELGLDPQDIVRIGAGDRENEPGMDWASLINQLKHLSEDPSDQKLVQEQIEKYVDKIPEDATSVYLCCTHYPAFKNRIEQRLAETGRGHIPVIDPMYVQVNAMFLALGESKNDRSTRKQDTSPIVLTTGKPSKVEGPLKQILGDIPIVYTQFGEHFRLQLLRDLIENPMPMRRSALQKRERSISPASDQSTKSID